MIKAILEVFTYWFAIQNLDVVYCYNSTRVDITAIRPELIFGERWWYNAMRSISSRQSIRRQLLKLPRNNCFRHWRIRHPTMNYLQLLHVNGLLKKMCIVQWNDMISLKYASWETCQKRLKRLILIVAAVRGFYWHVRAGHLWYKSVSHSAQPIAVLYLAWIPKIVEVIEINSSIDYRGSPYDESICAWLIVRQPLMSSKPILLWSFQTGL